MNDFALVRVERGKAGEGFGTAMREAAAR